MNFNCRVALLSSVRNGDSVEEMRMNRTHMQSGVPRAIALGLATALFAFATFQARVVHAGCQSNSDCKGGRVCRQGACAVANSCDSDRDCPGDLVCIEKYCAQNKAAPAAPAPMPPPAWAPFAPAPMPPPAAAPYAPAPMPPPAAVPAATAPPAPVPAAPATSYPNAQSNVSPPSAQQGPGTAQALSGFETMVLDCASAPNDPHCRGQRGTVLSQTYMFPEPPRNVLQFLIGGGYTHGFTTGGNIFSGGIEIGASALVALQNPIPGPAGGSYLALVFDAVVDVDGGALVVSRGSNTLASGAVIVRPLALGGIEYDSFGAFLPVDQKQSLIGVHAFYALGLQHQNLMGDISGSDTHVAHGPRLGIVFDGYRPMGRRLDRGFVDIQVLSIYGASETMLGIIAGGELP